MIKKFEPKNIVELRDAILVAIESVCKEYGVTPHPQKMRYSDSEVDIRINFTVQGYDPDREDFNRYCTLMGLVPEDYGTQFKYKDNTYTVSGLKYGNKFCIVTKREDNGKTVSFTADIIPKIIKCRTDAGNTQ